jgi:hypothetical protein
MRWGTLMRHYLGATRKLGVASPTSIRRLTGRMPMATPRRLLVSTSRPAGLLPAALLRALPAAVPLTAIAPRADRHQTATTHARKQSEVRPHRQPSGCRRTGRSSHLRPYLQAETRWQRRAFWTGPGGATGKVSDPPGPSSSSAAARRCSPNAPTLSPRAGLRWPSGPPATRPPPSGGMMLRETAPEPMAENSD